MQATPTILPLLINSVIKVIEENSDEVTKLDQVLGDGDHVINLQRGLNALEPLTAELSELDWSKALQKIGMTLLSTMGGASGSLFGTLFITMSKAAVDVQSFNQQSFADVFKSGVDSVKKRGKAEAGEKTMLDVLIPVSDMLLNSDNETELTQLLQTVNKTAVEGMESTKDMLATKGRASYLEEKSLGHIDAGARTSQLIICAISEILEQQGKG